MKNELLHTPEGVRDLYGEECAAKEAMRQKISGIFHSYGFRDIQTPMFEFFDIFAKERGSVSSRDMFKFFDKEGNTLVLRPDITPSIARSVAKYYAQETMPVRLCYCGNTFINHDSLLGHMKEVTQIGAELIGDETSDADAEMLACVIDCFKAAGLEKFQVEIGHNGFMRCLLKDLNLDDEIRMELLELIEAKNFYGADEVLEQAGASKESREIFRRLSVCFGSIEKIAELKQVTEDPELISYIEYLEKLYSILSYYKLESYVYFDLAKMGRFEYYTGIIFQGYTYGTGDVLCTGGRYDSLLKHFGKDAPSVGFAINLDLLMLALSRQKIAVEVEDAGSILLYERTQKEKAIQTAVAMRKNGERVTLMKRFNEKTIEDYVDLAKRQKNTALTYISEDGSSKTLYELK